MWQTTLQFLTEKYRGLQGNPCNENRVFPVGVDLQGVPCKLYRVWVCSDDTPVLSTVVNSVLKIWLKILGDLSTKSCYFIRKNIAGNGPLVFRSVLCLNLCQKLVFSKRNGWFYIILVAFCRF